MENQLSNLSIEELAWRLEDEAVQASVVSKSNQLDWFQFAKELAYGGRL